jgi:hypothetical protein
VDGPANRKQGTGSLGNQASGKRSIHAKLPAEQIREIQFLQYRLDVVRSWPESRRRQILMQAIEERLAVISPGSPIH